jgi:hypothetical protein
MFEISIKVSPYYPSVADVRTAVGYPTVVTHHKLGNAVLSITNECLQPLSNIP